MKSYSNFKKQLLKDKNTKKAYEELGSEFDLIAKIIEKRIQKGMTQSELAQKMGTQQSAIARLESGSCNPSVAFLEKVASALDSRLSISFY